MLRHADSSGGSTFWLNSGQNRVKTAKNLKLLKNEALALDSANGLV
jgi:hypothetical protein